MARLHFLLCIILQLLLQHAHARSWCKPNHNCWPSHQIWKEFNNSLHGRLVDPRPSAFYCHNPNYNSHLCSIATNNWTNGFWRSDQVGSMQVPYWESLGDKTCLINSDPSLPCKQGAVPVYAVNVKEAEDIEKSLKFAAKHNVRIVVKNTGHDFLGRSAGEGALSIWVHNLKGVKFEGSFVAEGCKGTREKGVKSLSAEAGVQWKELYEAAEENGVVVIGGGCSSVGAAGGFVQGGGQSPLSTYYGIAADNVLQFNVVTPDGNFRFANKCQNKDLFWALRGGGGGTFGIVTSVTFRTFPALQNLIDASYTISSQNSSHIKNLTSHFASIIPQLADSGWSGTFLLTGLTSFSVQYLLPNKNISSARASFSLFLDYLHNHPQLNITDASFTSYPSFQAWHNSSQCSIYPGVCSNPTGSNVIWASRLVPRTLFEQKPNTLSQIFMDGLSNGSSSVYAVMSAGGNVSVPRNNAVNPAWRKALGLVAFGIEFAQNSSSVQARAYIEKLSNINAPLRNLTPESGSYLNQADYNEPNWQQSLFGHNYPRLLRIKQKLDPFVLLTCHFCVGSEDEEDG